MSANVLAAPTMPTMEGISGQEMQPSFLERAREIADELRYGAYAKTGVAIQKKNAIRANFRNLVNTKAEAASNPWVRRAWLLGAAAVSAVGATFVLKTTGALASPEAGDVSGETGVDVAESDTAATLATDHGSVATGHFTEGTEGALTVADNTSNSIPSHALPAHTSTANAPWGQGFLEGTEGDLATGPARDVAESDTAQSTLGLFGHLKEGAKEAATSDIQEGAGDIDAQDNDKAVAAPVWGGGHTADNEGAQTATGIETTTDETGYDAQLGKFKRDENGHYEGTIEWHLRQAAEEQGLHLSDEDLYRADQRYLEMNDMSWDDARHLSNNYHIKLTEDQLHQIFDGLGEDDDTDTDSDDEGGTDSDKDDKKTSEEERRLEAERKKLEKEEGIGGTKDSEKDARLAYEHRRLENDPGLPADTANVKPSASSSAVAAAAAATSGTAAEAQTSGGPHVGAILGLGAATTLAAGLAEARRRNIIEFQVPPELRNATQKVRSKFGKKKDKNGNEVYVNDKGEKVIIPEVVK